MARVPKIAGGLPEVTEWSPEGSQPSSLRPNQPAFHGDGRYGGTPNPPNPTAPAPAAGAAAAEAGAAQKVGLGRRIANAVRSPVSTLRSAGSAVTGAVGAATTPGGIGYGAGRVAALAGRVAPLAGAAAAFQGAQHLGDYKIDDPSVDSSAGGTFSALRQGDFAGAGRSLSKSALEAGMDLGSAAASAVDLVRPGTSASYDKMLRDKFGDQLTGPTPAAPAAPTSVAATPPNPNDARLAAGTAATPAAPQFATAPPPNQVLRNGNNFSGDNVKEGFKYTNGGATGGNVSTVPSIGVEGYMKQLANIRALDGPGGPPQGGVTDMGGSGGGFGVLSAASQAARNASMDPNWMANHDTGGSMSGRQKLRIQTNSAQAIANQAQMGESQRALLRESGEMGRAGLGASTQRRGQDIQAASADAERGVQQRGQDISYAGHMAPLQLAAMQRGMHRDVYQSVGGGTAPTADHHLAAANQFDAMGLTEQAKGARDAAAQMQGLKGTQESQGQALKDNASKAFRGLFMKDDKDGNRVVDNDAADNVGAMTERYAPGFSGMDPKQRAPIISHMTSLGQLMNNGLQEDTKVGLRGLNPLAQPGRRSGGEPPIITGAKVERIDPLTGLLTKNATGGDDVITTLEGRQIRIKGGMDGPQRAIVEQAIKGGGWAPRSSIR